MGRRDDEDLAGDADDEHHTSDRRPRRNAGRDQSDEVEDDVNNVASAELRSFIERVERLEEEKASIQGDIKDVFGEAKGRGYDTKAMRTIIKLRKKDADERIEEETILQTYMIALGME